MQTAINLNQNQFDVLSNMLTGASDEVKLKLISFLSDSLLKKPEEKKEKWADQFAGAWKDNRSAEEIIADIRNARTSNREIEL